jgi:hypothetical protein
MGQQCAQAKIRPTVTLMATNFISTPRESSCMFFSFPSHKLTSFLPSCIKSERQFSTGRRAMNFMQHSVLRHLPCSHGPVLGL